MVRTTVDETGLLFAVILLVSRTQEQHHCGVVERCLVAVVLVVAVAAAEVVRASLVVVVAVAVVAVEEVLETALTVEDAVLHLVGL